MGRNADRPSIRVFSAVKHLFEKSDLVIGNLESPLLHNGHSIQGKCTLRGNPGWAEVIKRAGISVLSLANNHIMDYGEDGLRSTINSLDQARLGFVGAGRNREEAYSPAFVDVAGKRISILARTSVIVSSPSYARESQPGVAFLDTEETIARIRYCSQRSDIVILIMHWGLEEYSYPSPTQRLLARNFVYSGVDILLGHHPHILQSVEHVGKGMVCYSLGNFLFDEFMWSFVNRKAELHHSVNRLSVQDRKGIIMRINLSDEGVKSYTYWPTYIQSNGVVKVDDTLKRRCEFDRISSRLYSRGYVLFWKLYSIRQEWALRLKPLLHGSFRWSKLRKLRLKHFQQIVDAWRCSIKIAGEKTTNPYK